jgi:hypothetical protein
MRASCLAISLVILLSSLGPSRAAVMEPWCWDKTANASGDWNVLSSHTNVYGRQAGRGWLPGTSGNRSASADSRIATRLGRAETGSLSRPQSGEKKCARHPRQSILPALLDRDIDS